jgi:hypothetical protein
MIGYLIVGTSLWNIYTYGIRYPAGPTYFLPPAVPLFLRRCLSHIGTACIRPTCPGIRTSNSDNNIHLCMLPHLEDPVQAHSVTSTPILHGSGWACSNRNVLYASESMVKLSEWVGSGCDERDASMIAFIRRSCFIICMVYYTCLPHAGSLVECEVENPFSKSTMCMLTQHSPYYTPDYFCA